MGRGGNKGWDVGRGGGASVRGRETAGVSGDTRPSGVVGMIDTIPTRNG